MTLEERFAWIRRREQRYLPSRALTKVTRGCMTGRVTHALRSAADGLRLPVSNARDIRMALATEIFEHSVTSFVQLTDSELWALDQWAGRLRRAAVVELRFWLEARYGTQPPLPGVSP